MKKTVKMMKIYPKSKLFLKAHDDDACYDIFAYISENDDYLIIKPGETVLVGTGIKLAIPVGYEGVIRPRSGMSLKTKLRICNSPGTIDAGYRNEVKIILENIGEDEYIIRNGDRIAQIGFREVPKIDVIEVFDEEELGTSDRGLNGFGSTGR